MARPDSSHTLARTSIRLRLRTPDGIEVFALVLMGLGTVLLVWGTWLLPPDSVADAVGRNTHDWAPGLLIDGALLWVVNAILRRHERKRVLSQIGSLSREFALDAIRRAREEGWLSDGSLGGRALSRASLAGADLSGAVLTGTDLSFSQLRGASLAYTDLRGADLTGADLGEADLRWADLREARLRWSDLQGAMLEGARLDGAVADFAAVDARQAEELPLPGAIVGGFLDEEQIREVRRTFDLVVAQGTRAVERFYERVFELAPETRAMFRTDPAHQSRKFLQSLKVIVSALHTPAKHVTVLQGLGERHRGYGVAPEHYAVVSSALLWAMEESLGSEFTPSARAAWERALQLMAAIMNGGSAAARPNAAEPIPIPA